MRTREVTLHDADGATLLTLLARDDQPAIDTPTRNVEGVQPPASGLQAAFGDGLYRASVLERDFAFCDGGFATAFHAKAAVDVAMARVREIRVSGWRLPIAAAAGSTEFVHQTTGFRVRLRFIPASAYWRDPTGTKAGFGVQNGPNVGRFSGDTFEATDVGRLLVWTYDNGDPYAEAFIVGFTSSEVVVVDLHQDISTIEPPRGSVAFVIYDAVTGIL